ncbi:MAG: hypothetical protein ACHQF4_10110 [Sphingobacteriales bacterium]
MSNFIKDCINGYALPSEIDDYIDQWHDGDSNISLHEFLGMSKKEYVLFVEDESYLPLIVTAHKTEKDIVTLMRDEFAMAARSDDAAKSKQLQKWLDNEKLWD